MSGPATVTTRAHPGHPLDLPTHDREYARHNGHADLIRERIDGVTGD
jgi:Protein of unknown function (DUF664)